MADNDGNAKQKDFPKSSKRRSKASSTLPQESAPSAEDADKLINTTTKRKKPRRKKSQPGNSTTQESELGHDNPNFNANNSTSTPAPNTQVQRPVAGRQLPPLKRGSQHSVRSAQSAAKSGDEPSQSNADEATTSNKPRKKSKRSKKKIRSQDAGMLESLGINLADIRDDIVDPDTDQDSDQENKTQQHQHMLRSQPIGKLFIEQSNGFKATEKVVDDTYKAEEEEDDENVYPTKLSAMAFALKSVNAFKTIAHFCMGILAGMAIWQTLYIFTITNHNESEPYLEIYRHVSVPINAVFYIILVIVTVATFDRYDIAKLNKRFVVRACTLQSGAVACILYLAALCINVSMMPFDDRLGRWVNGTTDSSREFNSDQERDQHVLTWKSLSVVRTVLVSLAWFIISLRPATHRLTKNLSNTEMAWANNDTNGIPMKDQTIITKA